MFKKTIILLIVLGLTACQADISPLPGEIDGRLPSPTSRHDVEIIPVTFILHRSGGIAGLDDEWRINTDGTILKNDRPVGSVSQERVQQLAAEIRTTGILDVAADLGRPNICPDCILTQVTLIFPEKIASFSISSTDLEDPASLTVGLINRFLQEALQ